MRTDKNDKRQKTWPQNCVWPEPSAEGYFWDADDVFDPLDEEGEDLLEIKEYFDGLVEEGRLYEDYSLNEDFNEGEEPAEDAFVPAKGEDYWDDGFDIESWKEGFSYHINLLKLPLPSPVADIQHIIGYEFVNENLLRQAFTRRAFGREYGVGDSEQLEFIGDMVLNTVVTREIARQLTEIDLDTPENPFSASYSEGEFTRIRAHFVSSDYLAERAFKFGLDKYILYGTGETPSSAACEDMVEALIGAVAADSGWDWRELENVVDRLLCVQVSKPELILKPSYYDLFNSWHQKKFGKMPQYEVSKGAPIRNGSTEYSYSCTLRYSIPENDKDIWTSQRVDVQRETRSKAREYAAQRAYDFVTGHGLWVNLKDAGIEPSLDDSINQLQELRQKKYIGDTQYEFFEETTGWRCTCVCDGCEGWGYAESKVKAKKKAAYMVLVHLMMAAGICKEEWRKKMWETAES